LGIIPPLKFLLKTGKAKGREAWEARREWTLEEEGLQHPTRVLKSFTRYGHLGQPEELFSLLPCTPI
jgi:hypothetical protein